MPIRLAACGFSLFLIAVPSMLPAQIRASELGTVTQTVDGTVFTIEYSRPVARGRDLFTGEVPSEHVWTPGANWATTIDVSKDVVVNGHRLPKGTYSLWMIIHEGDWEVVFDPRSPIWHIPPPELPEDLVRFMVPPRTGPHAEVLTFDFALIRPTGATLEMRWGTTVIPLEFEVESTFDMAVPEAVAAPHVGVYRSTWIDEELPEPMQLDSLVLEYKDGSLQGVWLPSWPEHGYPIEYAFMQMTEEWFTPAAIRDGKPFDVWGGVVVEFTVVDGRSTGFEVYADEILIGRGVRVR